MHRAIVAPLLSRVRRVSCQRTSVPLTISFQITDFEVILFRCTESSSVFHDSPLQVSTNVRIIAPECHSPANTQRSLKCHNVIDRVRDDVECRLAEPVQSRILTSPLSTRNNRVLRRAALKGFGGLAADG